MKKRKAETESVKDALFSRESLGMCRTVKFSH